MASNRHDRLDAVIAQWEREASDRMRGADRKDADYSAIERRLLRAQANVYYACARQLREVRHGG